MLTYRYIIISSVLDRGTCTIKSFHRRQLLKLFYKDMFLWKLPKRMFYLYYMTFEGLLIPDSGVPDLSLPITSARVCDKKGAKNVVIRHLLCFVWTFWWKPHAESEQSNIFYNLSIYLAAKNGIWCMLSWKCFFTLCEVDYCRMNGKVRRAGGTWSVSGCPHLQRLVYTLFRLFHSVFFTVFVLSWYRDLLFSEER